MKSTFTQRSNFLFQFYQYCNSRFMINFNVTEFNLIRHSDNTIYSHLKYENLEEEVKQIELSANSLGRGKDKSYIFFEQNLRDIFADVCSKRRGTGCTCSRWICLVEGKYFGADTDRPVCGLGRSRRGVRHALVYARSLRRHTLERAG